MAPLIKAKVTNKAKGQIGHLINQNDPNGLINKVDSAISDIILSCSSLLLN